jgi:ankyrin repeat protein
MKILGCIQTIMNAPRWAKTTAVVGVAMGAFALHRHYQAEAKARAKAETKAAARALAGRMSRFQQDRLNQGLVDAVQGDRADEVGRLLAAGTNPRKAKVERLDPMEYAISEEKSPEMIQALYRGGATQVHFVWNHSPLDCAISHGKVEAAQALVDCGVDFVEEERRHGNTFLSTAAGRGHVEAIAFCLRQNPNYSEDQKAKALGEAIWHCHPRAAQMLYEADATCSNALYLAIEQDSADLIEVVSRHQKATIDHLKRAIKDGKSNAVEALVRAGAPTKGAVKYAILWNPGMISVLHASGVPIPSTAIHDAIKKGRPRAIEPLKEAGVDVSARNSKYGTPMTHAIKQAYGLEAIEALVRAGANLSGELHTAANLGMFNEVEQLLALGADPTETYGSKKATALHIAVAPERGFSEHTLSYLLRSQADLEARDQDGNTPLLCAVSAVVVQERAIEMLIQRKASVNARNSAGEGVFHLLAKNRRNQDLTFYQALRKEGARLPWDIFNSADIGRAAKQNLEAVGLIAGTPEEALRTAAADPKLMPVLEQICDFEEIDINHADRDGKTALRIAIENGRNKAIEALSTKGADMTGALHFAVSELPAGRSSVIEQLVKTNPELLEERDENGCTPFLAILSNGVSLFLGGAIEKLNGSDAEATDSRGRGAFHILLDGMVGKEVSHYSFQKIAQRLAELGADPNAEDIEGRTPRSIIDSFPPDDAAKLRKAMPSPGQRS